MHGNSQTDADAVPLSLALGDDRFATVLMVEADTAAAETVRASLDGVLGAALRLERVSGLGAARARPGRGSRRAPWR